MLLGLSYAYIVVPAVLAPQYLQSMSRPAAVAILAIVFVLLPGGLGRKGIGACCWHPLLLWLGIVFAVGFAVPHVYPALAQYVAVLHLPLR